MIMCKYAGVATVHSCGASVLCGRYCVTNELATSDNSRHVNYDFTVWAKLGKYNPRMTKVSRYCFLGRSPQHNRVKRIFFVHCSSEVNT